MNRREWRNILSLKGTKGKMDKTAWAISKTQGQKAFAEHLKSKKILRKTLSCTTKEIEHELEAE